MELTERSAAQQHFLDLCELLDHPPSPRGDPVNRRRWTPRASSSPSSAAPPRRTAPTAGPPQPLKPGTTSATITADAASRVGELAVALRERGLDPHDVAHVLDRVVFSFFAEDVGLLPGMVVTRLLEQSRAKPGSSSSSSSATGRPSRRGRC